ncbi:cytochrome c oxidase assembly protein [Gordonia sp. (in: high G+C Gram-positive bacteria)]|uniref:cytochrome c oxidase assembly protein n=1 Tax=Gordonia sp. (in: high G+C Gram-positive bacteria) TaxID=84139 RepID=UPI0039E6990A
MTARDEMDDRSSVVRVLGAVLAAVAGGVAVAVFAPSAPNARALLGLRDPGALTTFGVPLVTAVGYVVAALAIGSALFAAFFVPPQPDRHLDIGGYRAMRWAGRFYAVWIVCSVAMIALSVSNLVGKSVAELISSGDFFTAYSTVADARTWTVTAVFALVAMVLARFGMHWGYTFGALAFGLLSLMPLALAGHSAAGGSHDIAANALILHIVAAVLWMGGLFAVVTYAVAAGRWRVLAVRRFSRVAFWLILVVGVSGVLNAAVRVSSFDELFSTTYGWIIVAKAVALLVLGALGAWHRRRTMAVLEGTGPEADRSDDAPRSLFVRFGLIELLVFAITYGIAVALAQTPPPDGVVKPNISPMEETLGYRLEGPPTLAPILVDWRFDLIFGTAAILLCVVYLRGVWRLRRRGDSWPVGRTVAWVLGCAALLFATSSGLGRYAPAMFSLHMINHMVLSMLVPVLLVLGGPITLALRALPVAGRDNPPGPREWVQYGVSSPVARVLGHPAVAVVMFVGSFYVLYLGGLFDAVVKYHGAHLLMNFHFLLSGFLFYWTVIGIDHAPYRLKPLGKLGVVWGALPLHAFFGVALMMTSGIIAESYYRSLMLPWHIDLAADQRVGGGIAWAAGEIPLVLVMVALVIQWNREDDKEARRYDRNAERDDDSELREYNEMLAEINRGRH